MSETKEKICPLRRIENAIDKVEGKGLCIEEECAWYFTGDGCAFLSLAISLDSIAKEGR